MAEQFETIIIGGGVNGLVTAAYLAKAGVKVLLLEKRPFLGGVASTEEIYPGFRVDSVLHNAGMFRSQIVSDLFLKMHNFDWLSSRSRCFCPLARWQSSDFMARQSKIRLPKSAGFLR